MTTYPFTITATDAAGQTATAPGNIESTTQPPPATGWTNFTPSADTQIIYCAAGGNDSTGAIGDINKPFKTIAAAKGKLRDGRPDWLLLKKGDSWNETPGWIGKSGRSATEPMIVGAWHPSKPGICDPAVSGSARPILNGYNNDRAIGQGGYLAAVGLEFRGSGSAAGFYWNGNWPWVLFENCKLSNYGNNVCEQGTKIFILRRTIVVDNKGGSHAQGIYIDNCPDFRIFESLFDNNCKPNSVFGRNIYIEQSCGKATVDGLISCRSGSEGIQLRSGGSLTQSLFVQNSCQDIGHQQDGDGAPAIHEATVTDNVITEGVDINSSEPRGMGLNILQAQSSGAGIHINRNIITHLSSPPPKYNSVGCNIDGNCSGVDFSNNVIYDWPGEYGALQDKGQGTIKTNNDLNKPASSYPDPGRTVAKYAGTLGLPATFDGFINALRGQSKDNWNTQLMAKAVNDYFRAGFGR